GRALELAISPDGKKIAVKWTGPAGPKTEASLSGVEELAVHDANTGKKLVACDIGQPVSLLNPTEPAADKVLGLQFSPDGKSLLGKVFTPSSACAVLKIWDTATGELRHKLLIDTKRSLSTAATFAAGGTKIFATTENALQVWPLPQTAPFHLDGEPGQILSGASLSGDGKRLAVGISKSNREIRVLDVTTSAKVFAATSPAPVQKFRLSVDGKRLVARLMDTTREPGPASAGTVVLWDLEEKKKFSHPLPPAPDIEPKLKSGLTVHDFSADGRRVA